MNVHRPPLKTRNCLPAILVLAACSLIGCKPDAAIRKSEVIGSGTLPNKPLRQVQKPPAEPSVPVGTVTGTIFFSGKAPVPVRIDTSMDPACDLGNHAVYSEQYAVNGGRLANVFVYVKSGPPGVDLTAGGQAGEAPVLDQRNCQYVPHVTGVMQGGFVEFRNADPTMHNIHTMPTAVGNETIDISQGPRGAPVTKRFDKPELMIPVRCNNHPWMNAFIDVSATPFFAVTGPQGTFTLSGLPAGDYVLGAVQEKLGEKTISVHVAPNATARAELSFGGAR